MLYILRLLHRSVLEQMPTEETILGSAPCADGPGEELEAAASFDNIVIVFGSMKVGSKLELFILRLCVLPVRHVLCNLVGLIFLSKQVIKLFFILTGL